MIGLASERYLNHVPHPEMCRAVEVEFLAGDLTVEEFEAELHFYLGLGAAQRRERILGANALGMTQREAEYFVARVTGEAP